MVLPRRGRLPHLDGGKVRDGGRVRQGREGRQAEVQGCDASGVSASRDRVDHAAARFEPSRDGGLLARGRDAGDRSHGPIVDQCAGQRAMTFISKSNPASQVTPTAVQFG